MLIELSKLEGMPVGALEEGVLAGRVWKALVAPDELKVAGLAVQTGRLLVLSWLWPKILVAAFVDVVDIDKNGIAVRSRESLSELEEIVRLKEILKYKFSLLGLPAVTKSGERLGRVTDALVESNSGRLERLYVRRFLDSRVYERSQIVKMDYRKVVLEVEGGRKVKARKEASLSAKAAETVEAA